MARIHFTEKLLQRRIEIDKEILKLNEIINYYLRNDLKILFGYLDDKMGCYSANQFIELINSELDKSNKLYSYLDMCDAFLLVLKAYENFSNQSDESYFFHPQTDFQSVLEGIAFILNKLDYQIMNNDKGRRLITIKDAVTEEVAGLPQYQDVKWRILEYNSYKTTLVEKKAIINELYKKFEQIRLSVKNTNRQIETKLGELIQLVRHTKDPNKESKYPFYYKDEEKWCDNIYNLLLECFLHEENKKTLSEAKTSE